ncbi:MAG: mechanosensitive ion channel family protein [Thermoplasmata archaeon]|nr:mechanosensitive ion channel family protein [Thermoplasmata archaeon]
MALTVGMFSLWEWTALALAAIVLVGGYVLSRNASARIRERGAPPHQVRAVRIAISVVASLLVVAIVVIAFGPVSPVSGLTASAFAGLVATFALQTTLANVVAGFLLLRNKVLRLNDGIEISGVKGKVVQIGLVTTWLRLEDGALASVSNSTLLSGPMINRSAGERLKGEY